MKRSEINAHIKRAEEDFAASCFALPAFASWSAEDWAGKGGAADWLIASGHGWDVTDYGEGRFLEKGLLLFTVRNGLLENCAGNKPYAEKIMISRKDQLTPMHRHNIKVEDIIVRNALTPGATLAVQVMKRDENDRPSETAPVQLYLDGVAQEVAANSIVRLKPGESITLFPDTYHAFWGDGGDMVVGEVSSVNDDRTDNVFAEPLARFSAIDEDEPIYRPLVNDHPGASGAGY